jgi:hypothetical protein
MTGADWCDPVEAVAGGDDEAPHAKALAPAQLVEARASAVRSLRLHRPSRKSGAVALALSLLIHALVLVLLVRAGILFIPASVAVQGGAASGEVAEDVAGDGGAMRASSAVALPSVADAWAPAAVDLLGEVPPEILPLSQRGSDLTSRLTDGDECPLPIGLAGTGMLPADATFPHHYPVQWQNVGGGGGTGQAAVGGAVASNGLTTGEGGRHGGGAQAADGFSPVGSARNRPPAYPAEARRRKYEGTVWLLVDVREDGSVGGILGRSDLRLRDPGSRGA